MPSSASQSQVARVSSSTRRDEVGDDDTSSFRLSLKKRKKNEEIVVIDVFSFSLEPFNCVYGFCSTPFERDLKFNEGGI